MKIHHLLAICMFILLTGCYDKIELENRGFAVSIGIDAASDEDNNYSISMAIPNASTISSGDGDETKIVRVASAETVSESMGKMDLYSSNYTDFGNTKLCVISEEILRNEELLREAMDTLERNTDISKRIILMSTDKKAEDILRAKSQDEPMVGLFVDNYFKNNASGFKSDLESVIRDLRFSEKALIPKITLEGEDLKIGGAALISGFKLAGFISEDDLRGFSWVRGGISQISVDYDYTKIPLKITKNLCKQTLSYENGQLKCLYSLDVAGYIEEYKFSGESLFNEEIFEELSKLYSESIRGEIVKTKQVFYDEYETDGFSLKENLRKKNYDLYKVLEDDFENVLKNINLQVDVNMEIKNTGMVK